MSMSLGSPGRPRAEINMTPMIDVLLVLIIIFMVIVPMTPRGLNTLLPQASRNDSDTKTPTGDLVVTVNGNHTVSINQAPVLLADLHDRLLGLFRLNPSHVMFVRAQKGLEFQQVAEVIDIARGVGLDHIALMTQ